MEWMLLASLIVLPLLIWFAYVLLQVIEIDLNEPDEDLSDFPVAKSAPEPLSETPSSRRPLRRSVKKTGQLVPASIAAE